MRSSSTDNGAPMTYRNADLPRRPFFNLNSKLLFIT